VRHTLLLAVADDLRRRELFQTLGGKGLFVVEATTVFQTVERICSFYPDAILLDLQTMKDNFDVCRKIRKVCQRPILISVSELDEEVKMKGHEVGVEYFILKPTDITALYEQIKGLAMRQF